MARYVVKVSSDPEHWFVFTFPWAFTLYGALVRVLFWCWVDVARLGVFYPEHWFVYSLAPIIVCSRFLYLADD
jgi:hypothetical protein